MSNKYVNLRKIVKYLHEEDIESHSNPEERLKKLYDTDNEHLLEILNAVHFYPELLKKDGEYNIPKEDEELIEWILKKYTSPDMKLIRKGEFAKADIGVVYKLLDGLNKILQHLEVDEETIMAQQQIMNQKTNYHITVRMWNMQYNFMRLMHDITYYMQMPTFNLTYDNKVEYLDRAMEITEEYVKTVRQAFTDIWKERARYVKQNAIPITLEEMQFSERSIDIINILYKNDEYVKIKERLKKLKGDKGFIKKYEKEKSRLESRLIEIFREEVKQFPIDVDKMTKIEKIMCLSDGAFQVHYDGTEKQAYVTFDVETTGWNKYYI